MIEIREFLQILLFYFPIAYEGACIIHGNQQNSVLVDKESVDEFRLEQVVGLKDPPKMRFSLSIELNQLICLHVFGHREKYGDEIVRILLFGRQPVIDNHRTLEVMSSDDDSLRFVEGLRIEDDEDYLRRVLVEYDVQYNSLLL